MLEKDKKAKSMTRTSPDIRHIDFACHGTAEVITGHNRLLELNLRNASLQREPRVNVFRLSFIYEAGCWPFKGTKDENMSAHCKCHRCLRL